MVNKKVSTKYDADGYDAEGFNSAGFNRDGFNAEGFDIDGYDIEGFNAEGFDRQGYMSTGLNKEGYDHQGFDKFGFNKYGYNRQGLDVSGHTKKENDDFNKIKHMKPKGIRGYGSWLVQSTLINAKNSLKRFGRKASYSAKKGFNSAMKATGKAITKHHEESINKKRVLALVKDSDDILKPKVVDDDSQGIKKVLKQGAKLAKKGAGHVAFATGSMISDIYKSSEPTPTSRLNVQGSRFKQDDALADGRMEGVSSEDVKPKALKLSQKEHDIADLHKYYTDDNLNHTYKKINTSAPRGLNAKKAKLTPQKLDAIKAYIEEEGYKTKTTPDGFNVINPHLKGSSFHVKTTDVAKLYKYLVPKAVATKILVVIHSNIGFP